MARLQRITHVLLVASAALAVAPAIAAAQPDVRDIRPLVMLMLDTSGSMERMPGCRCTTPACEECYPACGASTARNRWAIAAEALTGSFNSFSCVKDDRSSAAYSGQYDYRYFMPHHRLPVGVSTQITDGALDAYITRIRFGLMTFDAMGTFSDSAALIDVPTYNARLGDAQGSLGMFSFGLPKVFNFPGCLTDYMMDNGARNQSADVGRLISVGIEGLDDHEAINAQIQNAILGTRPFGPTPIAGMLDDLRHYFDNHPDVRPRASPADVGDPYYPCRRRYAILITDGSPNADMREDPFNCDTPGFTCPYERAEEIAADLCRYDSSRDECAGRVDGVFVVGLDVTDPADVARLNDIASLGGTGAALLATDRTTLLQQIAIALDSSAPGTTTRTVPVFSLTGSDTTQQRQLQFSAGFEVGSASEPWSGILERTRFECNGLLEPEMQDVETSRNDRFHVELNERTTPRRLLTVVPSDFRNVQEHLIGEETGVPVFPTGGGPISRGGPGRGGAPSSCDAPPPGRRYTGEAETRLTLGEFSKSNGRLTKDYFGVPTSAQRDAIIDWVHAAPGSGRENHRLGDIYHSSPVVVGAPTEDIPDESFNLWRQLPEVANRPTVVYVGTNDGVIHAFAAEDTTITEGPHRGTTIEAGTELWGFVPPFVFRKIPSAMVSHQYLVDGTPVVRNVFYQRLPGESLDPANASQKARGWHTVLIVPLGRGGAAYVALDVTDPLSPKFLWQYTHGDMGPTLGTPAIGNVLVEAGGVLQERAIALLPAGAGDDLTGGSCGGAVPLPDGRMSQPIGCPAQGIGRPPVNDGTLTARDNQRCWSSRGRSLYFVDLATGELLAAFDDTTFNAPLTGGMGLFQGDEGTIATRAYFTDDDGVLYRLDMTSPRMSNWSVVAFHDIFWDGDATAGQPAYGPPLITTDNQGNVVIVVATGDIDQLDGLAANRVVSLTENVTFTATGGVSAVEADVNWEIPLNPGQQVTGPLQLFDSIVYFATFQSISDPTYACAFGNSHLWGVKYREGTGPVGALRPRPGLESSPGSGTLDASFVGPYENQVIMGVGITQRPTCFTGASETDPYFGSRYVVDETGGGDFVLVANVSGGTMTVGGGSIAQVIRTLPRPISFTRPESFAGTVD